MARHRQVWSDGQPDLDPERLIFVDESGATTKMARLRGRARRGERCRAPLPHGHCKTTTFDGALRLGGMTAPMALNGPMDGPRSWPSRPVLAPTLAPGETVAMDNLPAHKVAGVRETLEATGTRLHLLPPYSPDFNPSELAFAKFKAILQDRRAHHPRTLGRHRRHPPAFHLNRVRQRLQSLRI